MQIKYCWNLEVRVTLVDMIKEDFMDDVIFEG